MNSLHTKTVSDSKSLLTRNRVLRTTSPQIAAEEANLPRPYRIILSQLGSSFCSLLYYYRAMMGLIISLCPSCGIVSRTPYHPPWFLLLLASNNPEGETCGNDCALRRSSSLAFFFYLLPLPPHPATAAAVAAHYSNWRRRCLRVLI